MNAATVTPAQPTVAVVGSGPSGCYIAQFLRKQWRDSEIVVFDRLATPYGLVRYGVAPDHPGTKAVTKQFDRLFSRESVTFVGNTVVGSVPGRGRHTLDDVRRAFDIVVLATGLHADRPLGDGTNRLPGSDLDGVYGAGRLTRLINGHPEESAHGVHLGRHVVIVGHGNVAIDLVRMFLTEAEQLRALDISAAVVDAISNGPVQEVDLVGRSSADDAKFDVAMIRELARLPGVAFEAVGIDDATTNSPKRDAIAALVAASDTSATRVVRFHFRREPIAVLGDTEVTGVRLRALDGGSQIIDLGAESVCSAIGFTEHTSAPLRRSDHESAEHVDLDRGVLGDGLYCVGWLRRGPRGTIPDNRADARMVADTIVAEYTASAGPTRRAGLTALNARLITTTP